MYSGELCIVTIENMPWAFGTSMECAWGIISVVASSAYWVTKPVEKSKYIEIEYFREHNNFGMDRHIFAFYSKFRNGIETQGLTNVLLKEMSTE